MHSFTLSLCSLLLVSTYAFEASDFLVKGLEEIEPNYAKFDGMMYAGLLPIDIIEEPGQENDERRGELMFWLFQANKDLDSITM